MTEAERRLSRVVARLLALVREGLPDAPSPYLVRYLAEHVAEAQAWQQLADQGEVVDWLDPHRIAAEVLRVAFGRSWLPSSVAAVLAGHHVLAAVAQQDRATIRAIEASRYSRAEPADWFVSRGRWRFVWSRLRSEPLHVILGDHASGVTALVSVSVGPGRSPGIGADDGVVWPSRGSQVGGVEGGVGPSRGSRVSGADGGVGSGRGSRVGGADDRAVGVGRVLLVTGAEDGTVRLWDPLAGQPVFDPIAAHRGAVTAMVTTLDGFATGGEDGVIRHWSATTGRLLGQRTIGAAVRALARVKSGEHGLVLAAADADGTIQFWSFGQDPADSPLSPFMRRAPDWRPVWPRAVHPEAIVVFSVPGARVNAVVGLVMPDGVPVFAAGTDDGLVKLWHADTGQAMSTLEIGHRGPIIGLTIVNVQGQAALVSAGADSTVRVTDPHTGTTLGGLFARPVDWVTCLVPLEVEDRTMVVVGTDAGAAWLLDPVSGRVRRAALGGHLGPVAAAGSLALRDGRVLLVTGGEDSTVRLWSTEITEAVPDGAHHRGSVRAAAALREHANTLVFTGSADGLIVGWDWDAGQVVRPPWQAHPGAVTVLCTMEHPEFGQIVVSGGDDGDVRFWDAGTGEQVAAGWRAHDGWVRAILLLTLPDGTPLLATGGNDGTVRIWDVESRAQAREPLRGHANSVRAMTTIAAAGESILFTAGNDQTVRRWRLPSFEPKGAPLTGHTDWVRAVTSVTLGKRTCLVTGGNDGTIMVWDAATGKIMRDPVAGHRGTVRALGVVTAPGGQQAIVSIGGDQTVRLWDVDSGAAIHSLPLDVQPHTMVVLGSGVLLGTDSGVLMLATTWIGAEGQ